jgi:hypothetical protein
VTAQLVPTTPLVPAGAVHPDFGLDAAAACAEVDDVHGGVGSAPASK